MFKKGYKGGGCPYVVGGKIRNEIEERSQMTIKQDERDAGQRKKGDIQGVDCGQQFIRAG